MTDECVAYEWTMVPAMTLETLEVLGWIPVGSARRCRERSRLAERDLVAASR